MATLSELVDAVAEAEAMDSATVALIARYAREAGFIQKKGRGPSAAHMGVADAANLLIAVNASGAAREAPDVIPVYRDLIAAEFRYAHEKRAPKIYGSFGEAIELLLQSAIEGKLPETFLSLDVPGVLRDTFQQGNAQISISFNRPEPRASIGITGERSPQDLARLKQWVDEIAPHRALSPAEQVASPGPRYPVTMPPPSVTFSFSSKRDRKTRTAWKLKAGDRADETKIGNLTIFSVPQTLGSSQRYERRAQ